MIDDFLVLRNLSFRFCKSSKKYPFAHSFFSKKSAFSQEVVKKS